MNSSESNTSLELAQKQQFQTGQQELHITKVNRENSNKII